MEQVLEILIHSLGYFILYVLIDYDREEPKIKFGKKSFFYFVIITVLAVELLKIKLK